MTCPAKVPLTNGAGTNFSSRFSPIQHPHT